NNGNVNDNGNNVNNDNEGVRPALRVRMDPTMRILPNARQDGIRVKRTVSLAFRPSALSAVGG
ncbi:MAG: hypothetical protein FWD58_05350, partial [Firmicutes bacterium]|nr:hypothetical protein [Bacillota bacterium]